MMPWGPDKHAMAHAHGPGPGVAACTSGLATRAASATAARAMAMFAKCVDACGTAHAVPDYSPMESAQCK